MTPCVSLHIQKHLCFMLSLLHVFDKYVNSDGFSQPYSWHMHRFSEPTPFTNEIA
jgi:hypothetical protein